MQYRLREPIDIADECEQWIKQAEPRGFDFVDSVFNSPQSHAIGICEELIKRKINRVSNTYTFRQQFRGVNMLQNCPRTKMALTILVQCKTRLIDGDTLAYRRQRILHYAPCPAMHVYITACNQR